MVKYSARVTSGGSIEVKRAGNPNKKKKPIEGTGGDIVSGGTVVKGGAIVEKILKDVSVSPSEDTSTGGKLPSKIVEAVKKAATGGEKLANKLAKVVSKTKVSGVPNVDLLKGIVNRVTHHGMIQVLQNMDLPTFHTLQGVVSAHMPQFAGGHPLASIAKEVLGGSFVHPRNISKMASRDILRAVTPQLLSMAVHGEMLDKHKGGNVGGGLLSSLKYHFNRGLDGLKSKVAAGTSIGKKLQSALSTGLKVGQVFSPIVNALFPGAGALLDIGLTAGEALKAGLEKGIRVGEKIEKSLEGISPLETAQDESKSTKTPDKTPSVEVLTPSFAGLSQAEIASLGF